jgi:hypothetical protein
VHRAAHLLANEEGQCVEEVRRAYRALLAEMLRRQEAAGALAPAVRQFVKVSTSYWAGLFHCYEHSLLPRTNNDLEHLFGSARYRERRASGRKVASPALVLRGSVRVIAAVATPPAGFTGAELAPADLTAWRTLRQSLDARHERRRAQLRFRRDPAAYLSALEHQLLQPALPP